MATLGSVERGPGSVRVAVMSKSSREHTLVRYDDFGLSLVGWLHWSVVSPAPRNDIAGGMEEGTVGGIIGAVTDTEYLPLPAGTRLHARPDGAGVGVVATDDLFPIQSKSKGWTGILLFTELGDMVLYAAN